jgi:hypothetical protein
MTDRYFALTVTLERTIRQDDAEALIKAIKMIKGVAGVVPIVANTETYWARESARRELEKKLLAALREEEET